MSRATIDLQSVRFFLGYGLIFFAQHALTIATVTIVLFVYEWKLALVVLALAPLVVAIAHTYSRVSHPALRDVQQQLGEVATVAEESIVGVHVVKSFAQECRRRDRFRNASDDVFQPRASAQTANGRCSCRCWCSCLCSYRLPCSSSSPAGWSSPARSPSAPSSRSTCSTCW